MEDEDRTQITPFLEIHWFVQKSHIKAGPGARTTTL